MNRDVWRDQAIILARMPRPLGEAERAAKRAIDRFVTLERERRVISYTLESVN